MYEQLWKILVQTTTLVKKIKINTLIKRRHWEILAIEEMVFLWIFHPESLHLRKSYIEN